MTRWKNIIPAVLVCSVIVPASGAVDGQIEYCFFNNPQVRSHIRSILLQEQVPAANIQDFFRIQGAAHLRFATHYKACSKWNSSRNPATIRKYCYENTPDTINCRMGIFSLIRGLVTSKTVLGSTAYKQATRILNKEVSVMRVKLHPPPTREEANTFVSLFGPVLYADRAVDDSIFHFVHGRLVRQSKLVGLSFPTNPKLKIMRVYQMTPRGAHCEHAGLVIKHNNMLYLIEKISYHDPFLVSRFHDYSTMGVYLDLLYQKFNWTTLILINDTIIHTKLRRK